MGLGKEVNLPALISRALGDFTGMTCLCPNGRSGSLECLKCCIDSARHVLDGFAIEQHTQEQDRKRLIRELSDAQVAIRNLERKLRDEASNG